LVQGKRLNPRAKASGAFRASSSQGRDWRKKRRSKARKANSDLLSSLLSDARMRALVFEAFIGERAREQLARKKRARNRRCPGNCMIIVQLSTAHNARSKNLLKTKAALISVLEVIHL
jgi:hypothetical protein